MGGEKELAATLLLAHARHDFFGDETVVQIVLRLVDDERARGLEQQEQQHGGGLLTGGEPIECLPVLRLARRCGVEFDSGRGGKIEFLDLHEGCVSGLSQTIRLATGDVELDQKRRLAPTTGFHELAERQAVSLPQSVDCLGQSPTDFVAEELKQRLAVPGKLDPHADAPLEPASDALAGPLQGPKLARLHILPFGQQIPSPFLFVSLRPRQRRLPPLEGTQFFDSAPEANELLAVDATLLKIPKLLLVLGLHRGPTRLEPFADTAHSFHRPVQHGFQPVPHVLKVGARLVQDEFGVGENLLPGKILQCA